MCIIKLIFLKIKWRNIILNLSSNLQIVIKEEKTALFQENVRNLIKAIFRDYHTFFYCNRDVW